MWKWVSRGKNSTTSPPPKGAERAIKAASAGDAVLGERFDLVVIGASPSNLATAVAEARSGWSVALLDSQSRIGGAWHSRELFGRAYEVATHMLSPFQEEYTLLEAAGVPLWFREQLYLDYGASPTLEEGDRIETATGLKPTVRKPGGAHLYSWAEGMILDDLRTIEDADYLKARIQMHLSQSSAFKYFDPGVEGLLRKLESSAEELGVALLLNTRVEEIFKTEGDDIILETSRGSVQAKRVVTGRHVDTRFTVDGEAFDSQPKTNTYSSLMVKIKSPEPQLHPYVAVRGHPNLSAVQECRTDMQKTDSASEDSTVFCLAGSWNMNQDVTRASEYVVRELIANTVFHPATSVVAAEWVGFTMQSIATATTNQLRDRTAGQIDILPVTNLMVDIKNRPDIWIQALSG